MTIQEIIRNRGGRAGSNKSWKVERAIDCDPYVGPEYILTHYGTVMVKWIDTDRGTRVLPTYIGTGNGTVSDQGGVNTAMAELRLPYYFSRTVGGIIGKDHSLYPKGWV